jgi:hypothetical protein
LPCSRRRVGPLCNRRGHWARAKGLLVRRKRIVRFGAKAGRGPRQYVHVPPLLAWFTSTARLRCLVALLSFGLPRLMATRHSRASVPIIACAALWSALPSWPRRSGLPNLSSLLLSGLLQSGQRRRDGRRRVVFGSKELHGTPCCVVHASAPSTPRGRRAVVGAASACPGRPHRRIRRSCGFSLWLCLSRRT